MTMADQYADYPELYAQEEAIKRRRKIAEMLMQQSAAPMETNQMAGGYVVPVSKLAPVAKILQAYLAHQQNTGADEASKGLAAEKERLREEDIGKARDALSPTPAQETFTDDWTAVPKDDQITPAKPKSRDEMRSALAGAMLSRTPEARGYAAMRAKFMEEDEARKATLDQRKWEATQRAQDKLDQIAEAARQGRITKEEADKRHRDTLVELKKMGGGMNERPFFQPVQTAQGVMAFNGRTGKMEPVQVNGAPVVGSASDPSLQGQIAGAKKTGENQAKRAFNMAGLGETIDQAEKLLSGASGKPLPTGSTVGTAVDTVAGWVGASPEGAKEAQTLKAIGGALTSKMPRMEGPQSDKDTQLYKEMAAVVGDSTVPRDRRLAALQIVKELWGKYESLNQAPSSAGAGGWSIRKIQ